MHYEIAVCDDSEADRRYLSGQVSHWAREAGHTAEIVAFDSAESFLFRYAEKNDYDILLLDIEMGEMDGVTMAKTLRRGNDTVQIVFITGYSEYIAEGYEVDALHYLMKPVREDRLFSVLDRATEKLKKNEHGNKFLCSQIKTPKIKNENIILFLSLCMIATAIRLVSSATARNITT